MSRLTLGLIATVGLSLLVAFVLFFNIQRRRLFRIIHFAEEMAGGNLTEHITIADADEIGRLSRALEEMRDGMGSMVIRLQDAATALTAASTEILESEARSRATRATRQAASVTETGATMARREAQGDLRPGRRASPVRDRPGEEVRGLHDLRARRGAGERRGHGADPR